MPVEVILPKVDMDMESGQISRWFAKEGDSIAKGQLLFEIETDKAAMEVDAPSSGILRGVTAAEGETVPVGQAVAWIYGEDEAYSPAENPVAPVEPAEKAEPAGTLDIRPNPEPQSAADEGAKSDEDRIRATPLARRIAREAGIDLAGVTGSGPKGRIQKKDVEQGATRARPAPMVQRKPTERVPATLNTVWLREGKDASLPAIVLVHGFGADLNSWRPMLAGGNLDNPVLGVDLPGHGGSPRTIPEDIEAFAELVEAAIDAHTPGRIVLAGHSFGGAIAARVADRGNVDVGALALIAPAGLGPEINGAFLSGFVRARSEGSLVPWMRQLVQSQDLLSKPFINATLAQSRDEELRGAQQEIVDRFFADGTQTFSIRDSLARLAVPARVIFGAADRVIPSVHTVGLPGEIAVHLFGATGHMPQIEQREKVLRILGELSRAI
ncbi:acetoin dehydrogenase dihydrolipoyllysine-residue acetyltransferase subunit [Phyllobacterium sp. 21LDTY02-6]|uniref:acetoin dehydrogenase dihydrolipoyllysine-residue acetyltransferase subunit n=1 Tax=Phyllobacterium sp. 21LDTY02-6 TaxID=2944903 RepID=UPI00202220B9|nr:acetoin dehydrogenase dihydrolipoyllysine-residue acetyltransferase subunit [Phyllobacterium sp. 21LDTY02-6]MCO4315881.1 acetoin dehydrogenase dihydrolipoyllysine-residue acetyltransferase subunit [Phyllobacterium sp. 21LDTY02-6]